MSKTTYLVTGIAGNLGGSVASQLLSEGKNVVGLVLDGDPAAARVPHGVKLITGDVTNSDSIEQFFEAGTGTDIIVIHCAAIVTVKVLRCGAESIMRYITPDRLIISGMGVEI